MKSVAILFIALNLSATVMAAENKSAEFKQAAVSLDQSHKNLMGVLNKNIPEILRTSSHIQMENSMPAVPNRMPAVDAIVMAQK